VPSKSINCQAVGSLDYAAFSEGFDGELISWRGGGSYQMAGENFAKIPKAAWN